MKLFRYSMCVCCVEICLSCSHPQIEYCCVFASYCVCPYSLPEPEKGYRMFRQFSRTTQRFIFPEWHPERCAYFCLWERNRSRNRMRRNDRDEDISCLCHKASFRTGEKKQALLMYALLLAWVSLHVFVRFCTRRQTWKRLVNEAELLLWYGNNHAWLLSALLKLRSVGLIR